MHRQLTHQSESDSLERVSLQVAAPSSLQTTSKKRKYAQITQSTQNQFESLSLHFSKTKENMLLPHSVSLPGSTHQTKRRKVMSEIGNTPQGQRTMVDHIHQMITLKRENSMKDVKPFSTIFNKNTQNSLLSTTTAHQHKPFAKLELRIPPVKENAVYLDVPASPRRLSHITEKSADERLTVKSKRTLRRSSSSCAMISKHRPSIRAASVMSEGLLVHQASIPRSSSMSIEASEAQGIRPSVLYEALGIGDDLYSDVAQLGTPHPFDLQAEDMNMFFSQSAISVDDNVSEEIYSQLDFLQSIQFPPQSQYYTTGPKASAAKRSGEGMHMSASTAAATAPPFMLLSPLNEFDEEFNNPLNTGMIVDSTATGFLWSKTRAGQGRDLLQGEPPTAVGMQEARIHPTSQVDYKLREQLDALNHSF